MFNQVISILFLLSLTATAQAQETTFELTVKEPARILGKYADHNSSTRKSWVVDTGTGIALVRVPRIGDRDLLTSLWGDCRGALPIREADRLVDSDFCRATRNPEFDRPEQGLIAYTYGTPEKAAKKYRASFVISLLSLGTLAISDAVTTTFLVPSENQPLPLQSLTIEIRTYPGTTQNPRLHTQTLLPL